MTEEHLQSFMANIGRKRIEIADFGIAEDLRTVLGKVIVMARQLQAGTVYVSVFDGPRGLGRRKEGVERQGLCKLVYLDQLLHLHFI